MKITKLTLFFGLLLLITSSAFAQNATATVDAALKANREKIDSLDAQLLKVLGARESIVKEIGIYKAKNKIPALQAARFQQVVDRSIVTGKQLGLSAEFITELMNAVHKESLRIEEEIKAGH